MHYGSGSVVPSRSAGFTNTGSPRPARPGQLDQMMADNIAGGADPAEINEMCHASAAALLDRVHHTQDAELVERVLTLVDREGVDVIAELWSHADPDSLPGILWRLYLLRTWMRKNRESIARLWRVGEPRRHHRFRDCRRGPGTDGKRHRTYRRFDFGRRVYRRFRRGT